MPLTPEATLSNHWAPPWGLHESLSLSLSYENYQAHSQAPTTKRTNLTCRLRGKGRAGLRGASSHHCLLTHRGTQDPSLSREDTNPNITFQRIAVKHTMQSVNKAEAGRELILNDISTITTTVATSVATVSATLATICNASNNGDRQLTPEHCHVHPRLIYRACSLGFANVALRHPDL